MGQKILCISGRKQAGKDTCYKFLESLFETFSVTLANANAEEGRLGQIGQFYYAQALKRMCIDILGCPEDKVFGTDADKNELVPHLLWENFPVPVYQGRDGLVTVQLSEIVPIDMFTPPPGIDLVGDGIAMPTAMQHANLTFAYPFPTFEYLGDGVSSSRKLGPMSVREVLQYWGTEVFRRQYKNVWADACIRSIRKSRVDLAVITDCRFPNEVDAAHTAGGRVIRLSRVLHPEDTHASEVALDRDKYDWANFDAVVENEEMSVSDQCFFLYRLLVDWGWLPDMPQEALRKHYERAAA